MLLSDAERQDALDVLSEHVRTGRLDVDEYGTRSARVAAAKRVSELVPLFDDLPSPRPSALLSAPRATAAPPPASRGSTLSRYVTRYAVPISVVLSIVILVLSRGRLFIVFALPIAVLLLTGWRRR
ncbi:DUF1707 SHOCT-like domain-containing protein [Amycolatopsis jiangsuensis]|uniref:DUF1707 domain-containing protein n=2 Tax=Amycolatopsis jiangsuensis TaxID=1181879 RepID=A0A840IU61_9PSEU|nr:hypothetical protein [Amycolatopsis jiangsuensis]